MEESSPRPSQVIVIIIFNTIVIFNIIAFIKIFVMIVSTERRNMGKTSAFVGQARRIV